jgi:hypothetical protein
MPPTSALPFALSERARAMLADGAVLSLLAVVGDYDEYGADSWPAAPSERVFALLSPQRPTLEEAQAALERAKTVFGERRERPRSTPWNARRRRFGAARISLTTHFFRDHGSAAGGLFVYLAAYTMRDETSPSKALRKCPPRGERALRELPRPASRRKVAPRWQKGGKKAAFHRLRSRREARAGARDAFAQTLRSVFRAFADSGFWIEPLPSPDRDQIALWARAGGLGQAARWLVAEAESSVFAQAARLGDARDEPAPRAARSRI